jgi:membrane protein implicated in regulation of membrane protease activity
MKRDILESMMDIGSGFFIAIIIQLTIFPFYDIKVSIFENFQIALIFLIVSMTRSALWRRFFRRRKYDEC